MPQAILKALLFLLLVALVTPRLAVEFKDHLFFVGFRLHLHDVSHSVLIVVGRILLIGILICAYIVKSIVFVLSGEI